LAVPGNRHLILNGLCELFPLSRIAAFSALMITTLGCTVPAREPTTYGATVERVVERNGDFYSPVKGHKPLYCLYLRLSGSNGSERKELLQVLVLDLYVREIHGGKGDRVEFGYLGDLRSANEIDFDTFVDYRVVGRGG
jgi:hypothetical protein